VTRSALARRSTRTVRYAYNIEQEIPARKKRKKKKKKKNAGAKGVITALRLAA